MACSTWLHPIPFFISRRTPTVHSNLRRFHRLISASPRLQPPPMEVRAQARRLIAFEKEDEVASPADLSFQEPLKIVEYPDPILRSKNKRIVTFDDNLKKLVEEMFNVMYKTDGIGLSAPQVGINVQLMVFNPVGERGEGEEIVLVNPRVGKYSKKRVVFNEGCLSFPEIYADVERPESVKIDAKDVTGTRFVYSFSELPARVFQHEFDHLQGVLFFDRMTEDVLDGIRSELEALEKKYEDKTGKPSPEKIVTRQGRKAAAAGFGKSRTHEKKASGVAGLIHKE
ncbi:hypothetical protein RHGRI_028211 [Rhododendron griersonianum]|uniref:Peptide deformylase n=1 Tax=Rhododendron griersonianum TaxID=479676 RepID=A0AAV6IEY0_9ERIC|nr:hypothetical protein RHGRI_028211 [Rhododendron griersonianum]